MENMNPESLLRKAQALGDDIKEMESIDVMGAYRQTQAKIKTNRRKGMYNQLLCCILDYTFVAHLVALRIFIF